MADNKKTYTKQDVLDAWEQENHKGAFEIVEVETVDGESDQTQILSTQNGGLVVAVDGTGPDALKKLAENPRDHFIDPGLSPKEAVEDGKPRYTENGKLATPTHPQDLKVQEGLGDIDPADLNPGVPPAKAAREADKAVSQAKK